MTSTIHDLQIVNFINKTFNKKRGDKKEEEITYSC